MDASFLDTPTPNLPVSQASIGTIVVCVYVSLILFGILVHQVYEYLRTYTADHLYLKRLVLASLYAAHIPPHSWTAAESDDLELFFIRRTWIVGRKPEYKPLVAVAAVCSVAQLAVAIAGTVQITRGGTVEDALHYAWIASAYNGLAVAAHVLLTGILIISLHQQRTGITRTDSLIAVLMLYAINTGLVQTIINTLVLIFALIAPHDLVYSGLGMVGSRLYPITLLAALNAREGFNRQMQKPVVLTGRDVYALRSVTMDASRAYKGQADSV
ncbi:hypothetical protein OH77DRAFT_1520525 [Trametes cingulata]|nr:hypothetical protein OH77DRAFT_1520525 [Trametes cingulata]